MRTHTLVIASTLLLASPARAQDPAQPAQEKSAQGESAPTQPAQQPPAQPPRGGAAPSDDAFKYGSPAQLAEGTTQEQMWPAATAEGWAKPCLVHWQRSFDDALRVARATQAPILVCVNMDGEIASEHFAGVRYRDAETAQALARYVCVVASVYRHTPRDYDEQGRRVPCPRFGTVTCGEHIACETELYAKYFDGKRISPRHLMLEIDGTKSYDVYFSWDTQTVFTAFAKGVENRPLPLKLARDGVPMPERTQSADVTDREAIESAYLAGDHEARRALLRATVERRAVDQNDLLRLAVFGLDVELARVARQALAQNQTEGAVDLIAEALKVPLPPDEREQLVAAAERLGEKFPRARTLVALQRGLSMGSGLIEASREPDTSASAAEYAASVERRADDSARRPADAAAKLEFAESLLARAKQPSRDRRAVELWLADARANAEAAQKLGLVGWRTDATLAAIYDALGDAKLALEHAVKAVEGGMWRSGGPPMEATDVVKARVLALFAQARQQAIRKAYRENSKWPPEWLADVNAAYAALATHPLVSDENLVSYYDFLHWLGGARRANAVLDDALGRFPDSPLLHDRLRARVLWQGGPAALESEYASRVAALNASKQLTWFAGYASLVAAEHLRRRGDLDGSLAAYGRAVAYYERNIADVPDGRDLADHFVALAHAARARVALERGDLRAATDALLQSFQRRPDSAATADGLGITPVATARMLQAKLAEANDAALGGRVQAALDALDPKLLEPPESEAPPPQRARPNAPRAEAPPRGR